MNDMISRAGWTFVQGFLSVFVIADLATAKVAIIAGIAAALSVVKTYAVARVGS
jgi:hypothetical protein